MMKNQMNCIELNQAESSTMARSQRRNRTIYEIFSSLQIFAFVCEFINSRVTLRAPLFFIINIRTCWWNKKEREREMNYRIRLAID